jgi:putative ABC transport system permease protein
VFAVILLEASSIAAIGCAAAFVVFAVILGAAATIVRQETGVVLDIWMPHAVMIWAPLGMIALGAAAGIIPAVKAYSTDVASNLVPTS